MKKLSKRRDQGSGTLRERSNGSWEGRYGYIDPDTGIRVRKSVYAETKPEARRKLKTLINKVENGIENDDFESINIKPEKIILGEWLDTWMHDYKKNSIRTSTYAAYTYCIDLHILPALGNMELHKIQSEHIQKLLNDLGKKEKNGKLLTSATILKTKNILSSAFEQAVRNKIIPYNPVRATVSPKKEQNEIRILNKEEHKQFVEALKGHRLEALYLLALATGMRRGELLALTWDCIDWKNNSINVKSSVTRVKDPDTGKTEIRYFEPKTKSGRRYVPILPSMIPVLKAHKERQDTEKREAGNVWNDKNIVFCSNVGTIIEPRRVGTTLDKITKAAKIDKITFHALRHSFATRMLEADVPAKVVQDVLGHADVTLTLNTYSHVLGTTAHDQMSKINDLFKAENTAEPIPDYQPSIKDKIEIAKNEIKNISKMPKSKTFIKSDNEI